MTLTRLDPQRYFTLIDADTERMLAMGECGLGAPVPCCEGWDVAEVIWHTAAVFQHKVRVMADNAFPDPWPPADFDAREEMAFLRESKAELFAEFARHEVDEPTTTFSADDTTIAFWIRRMALESAVHRFDTELAHDDTTPVPADEALDGIDELLRVMLGGTDWQDRETEHAVDAVVAVQSGNDRWVCDVRRASVTVTTDRSTPPAAATVSGEPEAVFLWLWGRVGDEAVSREGDLAAVAGFRARTVECTG